MMLKVLSVILILISISNNSFAVDDEGSYTIVGVGAISCKQFVVEKNNNSEIMDEVVNWLAGYITAFNLLADETNSVTGIYDLDKQIDWMGKYCTENPHDALATAAQALTLFLYPIRIKSAPMGV